MPGSQKLQLTRSGTGCFIAVSIWQQWASNGYNSNGIFLDGEGVVSSRDDVESVLLLSNRYPRVQPTGVDPAGYLRG